MDNSRKEHFLKNILEKYKYILLYILYFSRFLFFGIKYYPQLDDYIQYYSYSAFYTLSENIQRLGLLSTRALAGILDIVLWSNFFEYMVVALAIISLLYVSSAIIFRKIFSKYIKLGNLFLLVYLFLPISIEGLYWISASSRIALGMFFISAGAILYQKSLVENKESKSVLMIIFSFIFQLLAFSLYEQVIILGISLYFVIFLLEIRSKSHKKYWVFLTFLNLIIILLIMKLNSTSSVYSSRIEIILPSTSEEYRMKLYYLNRNLIKIFFLDNFYMVFSNFISKISFEEFSVNFLNSFSMKKFVFFIMSIIGIISTYKYMFLRKFKIQKFEMLVFSMLLAIAPISIFYIIESNYVSYRNVVTSLLGIAIFVDVFLSILRNKLNTIYRRVIMFACLALLIIASYNEIEAYKKTYEMDTYISKSIAEYIGNNEFANNKTEKIYILNLKPSYVQSKILMHNEHIVGTTSSDWALKGNVKYILKSNDVPDFKLVGLNHEYRVKIVDDNISEWLNSNSHILFYSADTNEIIDINIELESKMFKKNTIVYDIIKNDNQEKIGHISFKKMNDNNYCLMYTID